MTTHSIRKILSKVKNIQSQLTLAEIRQASRSAADFRELNKNLLGQITHLVNGIDRKLAAGDLTGADLAIRSRRGYQWLKFLTDPSTLLAHLDFLQRVNLFLAREKGKVRKTLAFSLYHQGSLYKISQHDGLREIVIQESFLTAPDRIIQEFLEISRDPSSGEARTVLRDYTFSKEYRKNRERLEYLGIPPGTLSAGRVHHLDRSFSRVNQEYFQGKMARPHLVWNNRLTRRKFGHYQWDTDTVMVSSSLDQERVSEMVVDFVMYHELLHKKLGAKLANQNRIAHTPQFRKKENEFKQVEKARQRLNRLARKGK